MGKDKFEQYLQDLFKDHKVSIDTNEIWPGIEETLPPPGKATVWPYWAMGVVLIGLVSWFVIPDTSSTENDVNISSAKNLVLSESHNNQNNTVQKTDRKDLQTHQIVASDPNDSDVLSAGINEAALSGDVSSEIDVVEAQSLSSGHRNISSNQNAITNSSFKTSNRNLSHHETSLKQPIAGGNTTTASNKNKNVLSNAALERHNATSMYEAEQGTPSPDKSTSAHAMTTRHMEFSLLSPLPAGLGDIPTVENITGSTIILPSLNECYDFKGRSWGLAIDAYAGINYASKSLKSKSNEFGATGYINSRENSEDYLEAFDAGLTINLLNRRGYMASVGINYSQIDEKFNYFSVTTESRFDSVVTRINIDSTGMIDSVKEWRQVSVQTAREVLTYNYYRMVDIPIAVGYQFHKDKWTLEVQGGVMFNLLFKKQGEILNSSLHVTEITDNDLVFKDKIGMSVFGSFKAIYPITNRIGVYAEPYGRFNLKSITSDAYSLDQKYNNFGLRLGTRFTF